jgi:Helix-turn-helix domain
VEDDTPKKTLSVPEAGKRYFDLGRNASYEAARRGELPVIKIGSRLRVPIVALERMLAEAGNYKAETTPLVSPQVLGGREYQHRSTHETNRDSEARQALRNDSGSVPVVVTTQRAAQLRRPPAELLPEVGDGVTG